jgi:hypothetical protein
MSEPNITEIAQDDPRLAELGSSLGVAWPLPAEWRAIMAMKREVLEMERKLFALQRSVGSIEHRVGALERQVAVLTPGIAHKGPEGGA